MKIRTFFYNQKIYWQLHLQDGNTANYKNANIGVNNQLINPNEWYTIVGTYDGKNIAIYVDNENFLIYNNLY